MAQNARKRAPSNGVTRDSDSARDSEPRVQIRDLSDDDVKHLIAEQNSAQVEFRNWLKSETNDSQAKLHIPFTV